MIDHPNSLHRRYETPGRWGLYFIPPLHRHVEVLMNQ